MARKEMPYIKQLSKEQCQGILEKLLQNMKNNRLQHSAINEVAAYLY